MKKKYILAFTFLCLLMGQSGYAQDYEPDFGGDIPSQQNTFTFEGINELNEVVITGSSSSGSNNQTSYTIYSTYSYLVSSLQSGYQLTNSIQSTIDYYASFNQVPPLLPTWYLDYDGDGYCNQSYQSESSPGINWKGWSYGYDCDDYDDTKTTDCNVLYTWYFDYDGDGRHSQTTQSESSPGDNWRGWTYGKDCNDYDDTKITDCSVEKPCIKANLADLVYDSHNGIPNDYSKLPDNVTIINPVTIPDVTFTNTTIGFNSTLYRVDNGNGDVEYIYATEGSTLELQDWLNNGQQATGNIAAQYDLSVDNAIKIQQWASTQGTPKISFTGHSLGGGLANANALATGYPATVFNPAGLHDNTISRLGLNLNNANNVNYYVNTGEIVDIANTLLSTPARGTRHEIGNNAVVPAAVWYTSTLAGVVYSGYLHTMGSVIANLDCD